MDDFKLNLIENILYPEKMSEAQDEIAKIDSSTILHIIAYNYNWDNGLEIPQAIINNANCDIGTAVMLFFNADGYSFLANGTDNVSMSLKAWSKFISNLYSRIEREDFAYKNVCFKPDLTKVQVYKLSKNKFRIPKVLLYGTDGDKIKIPVL